MKRLGIALLFIGGMFSAAIGKTQASPVQQHSVASHAQSHVKSPQHARLRRQLRPPPFRLLNSTASRGPELWDSCS